MEIQTPKGKCSHPDCTFAQTGKCFESHLDLNDCPNISFELVDDNIAQTKEDPIVEIDLGTRRFHAGNEIGSFEAAQVMSKNYSFLASVIGFTNAGKTSFLSSLYLLLTQGYLKEEYLFAGSLTLQGFEDRTKRVRKWEKGKFPEKLAEHTSLQDPRQPAFLHLKLKPVNGNKMHDFILTDLPGEWFQNLIENADTAPRFDFMHRSDVILFLIDATLLVNSETRHGEILKSKILLERIANTLKVDINIPLYILLTKIDELESFSEEHIREITNKAIDLGYKLFVFQVSAFSKNPDRISSGNGIRDIVAGVLSNNYSYGTNIIIERIENSKESRSFLNYY